MKSLELRFLEEKDLSALVELDSICFGGLWTREGYQRELDSPNSEILILVLRDTETTKSSPSNLKKIIGIGCFWSILEEAHITLLGIHPDYQRQGLGQLLLYYLLERAVKRQMERATLEVRAGNQAALSLYQKFAFQVAGKRKKYYPKTEEDALILWRGGLEKPEFKRDLARWKEKISDCLNSNYLLVVSF